MDFSKLKGVLFTYMQIILCTSCWSVPHGNILTNFLHVHYHLNESMCAILQAESWFASNHMFCVSDLLRLQVFLSGARDSVFNQICVCFIKVTELSLTQTASWLGCSLSQRRHGYIKDYVVCGYHSNVISPWESLFWLLGLCLWPQQSYFVLQPPSQKHVCHGS